MTPYEQIKNDGKAIDVKGLKLKPDISQHKMKSTNRTGK